MTNNKIQGYAERIENVLNEIDTLKADIKDLYEEVKSAQIKPKVLRKAIANKRRKVDAALEAEVEEYSAALLAMPGATYRSVAEQTGISKSKLQRLVPKRENGTEENVASPSGPSVGVPRLAHAPKGEDGASTNSEEGGDRQSASRGGEESAASNTASASSPPPETDLPVLAADILALPPKQAAAVIAVLDALTSDELDLTIPAHLRRTA